MPITFNFDSEFNLPIDVRVLRPANLSGLAIDEIQKMPIGIGNVSIPLAECCEVSGEDADHLVFTGHLLNVHHVGHGLESGKIEVRGDVGLHVGDSMHGGELIVTGNVSDYAGYEMRGGTMVVHENAGDHVGGCYPGAKYGMNRGTILIAGNAGKGVGYRMRRGTIVVIGDAGPHLGWQLTAGTIFVFGNAKSPIGLDMKRGTIVLANSHLDLKTELGRSYSKGISGSVPAITMLSKHIASLLRNYDIPIPDASDKKIEMWHGDGMTGFRGEVCRLVQPLGQ